MVAVPDAENSAAGVVVLTPMDVIAETVPAEAMFPVAPVVVA